MSRKSPISDQVWRKGWRQEAAATQAASADLADCLNWLVQQGHDDSADVIRAIAMKNGVRETAAAFLSTLRSLCEER